MKKFFLFPLLGLLLTACSTQDPTINNGGDPADDSARAYLTLNLVSGGSIASRAEGDVPPGGFDGYQDGEAEENAVEFVRFYFFTQNGDPAPVKKLTGTQKGYFSYVDWYPSAGDVGGPEHNETVEKVLNATLGITFPDGSELPALVLAVINPSAEVQALTPYPAAGVQEPKNASLEELRAAIYDFKTDLTDNNFVMSNSVYLENGQVVDAKVLESENFGDTPEEAADNAIVIYVERVLARLDFKLALTGQEVTYGGETFTIYPTRPDETADSGNGTYDVDDEAKEIYVRFLGWNITGTPTTSRLVKSISNWDANLFGTGVLWNTADYHRSFWAINPSADTEGFEYLYGNFGTGAAGAVGEGNEYPANSQPLPTGNEAVTIYLQENAAADAAANGPEYATKVIIAAQLVDETGKPYEVAQWGYKKYTVYSLKKAFANRLNLYRKVTNPETGSVTYTKIQPEDLEFVTWEDRYPESESNEDTANYYVYAQLTSVAAEQYTWTLGNTQDAPVMTTAQVNDYIRDDLNHAMVWKGGLTYYYFDIRHLALEGNTGAVGIVRNHLYETTVKSLTGLGTPVFNPDQVIYPEMTEYDESIISATVKILQWRIVAEDYELTWK